MDFVLNGNTDDTDAAGSDEVLEHVTGGKIIICSGGIGYGKRAAHELWLKEQRRKKRKQDGDRGK